MEEALNRSTPEPSLTTGTFRALAVEQRLFDRYLLQRELGRGGRGIVWLALDLRLHCLVALKFLAQELVREADALDELRHETLVSRKITHPHIMRIYDFEQDPSTAAISMEFVDGDTLSQLRYQREQHCFSPDELLPWVLQLADALYYAHHEAGIVHRDLKPSNLMVGRDRKLKITDFGIASVIADSLSRVTRTQIVSGTLPYMSPQQALGDLPRETDDIYSFGAVIYELLTSRPPFFRGRGRREVFVQVGCGSSTECPGHQGMA
jgi:serine/threonine protein kinase